MDNNRSTPPLFDNVLATEASRTNIINSLNKKLIEFNTNTVASILSNINDYINPTRNVIDKQIINNVGLEQIKDYIPENISYWQPVMQISRSSNGDGTVNYPKGTAAIITMYNGERKESFFTEEDVSTDENNIPLCFFGYNLNSPSGTNSGYNKVPNSPIFNTYSKEKSKAGYLFPTPNNTSGGTVLYHQFTFPYNCYLYITANASTNWNSPEASAGKGEPIAFMINDEEGNNIVSRTSYDDGTGNYTEGKNRYFCTVFWHGYVKKGWKFYYAEQDNGLNGFGKSGYNCVVFKTDNVQTKNVVDMPVLSMRKFSTSSYYNSSADIDIQLANSEYINSFIVENESKLTNLATKATIPNTPLFTIYSIANSKPGALFPVPGTTNYHGYWATLAIPYDCYMSFSLMGCHQDSSYETYGVYGLMIYDENNNLVVAKTSYDDGTGKNTTDKNRYWGNIHYTGILKKGYKVYFAWIRNAKNIANSLANQEFITNGLLVNLFRLPPTNLQVKSKTLTATNSQTAVIYDSITNTTITESNQVIPTDVVNLVDACISLGFANGQVYNCFVPKLYTSIEADCDSIAIISLPNSASNGVWRVHSFYIHTTSNNNIISYKYSGTSPINSNLSITEKIKVNAGDKIYVFIVAGDKTFPNSLHYGFASVSLIPVCYITENH